MPLILADSAIKTSSVAPEMGPRGSAAPGLVISPITPPADLLGDLVRDTFRFPSADMLGAAAGMFPRYGHQIVNRWLESAAMVTVTLGPNSTALRGVRGESREYRDNAEGPQARIELAPGLVRVSMTDWNRSSKADERRRETAVEKQLWLEKQLARPMALADFDFDMGGTRERITRWSADSRARLVAGICELDLSGLIDADRLPCMVTLTLPGDWLAVAPSAKVIAKKFDNFMRSWEKKWGPQPLIWKREFQGRFTAPRTLAGLDSGRAPHWHLWLVPPVPMVEMKGFREWLSLAWTTALQITDDAERAASLKAGTGVDFAEGLRARDPKRLAVYFLKESLGGEGKAYQNESPPEWDGESVGRFWGYRRMEKAVVVVPVDGQIKVQALRVIRRFQKSAGTTEIVRTLDGRSHEKRVRVTREKTVQRIDYASGVVQLRKIRRPARLIGAAGWVAVNNGATFGARLGTWASTLSDEYAYRADRFIPDDVVTVAVDPPWLCTLPAGGPVAEAWCPERPAEAGKQL